MILVIELRSTTDRLSVLRDKLEEYLECGCQLGWLLDRETQSVEIFDRTQGVKTLQNVRSVSANAILPGFVFDLGDIW